MSGKYSNQSTHSSRFDKFSILKAEITVHNYILKRYLYLPLWMASSLY
jgi:hypothetical protein